MSKFKVGDKVRRTTRVYTDDPLINMGVGYEGVVTSVSPSGCFISVDNLKAREQNPYLFSVHNFELIEEPKMTQQFKAMKIRIWDAQHSRLVQEALFEMGYKWEYYGKEAVFLNQDVLLANNNGFICFSHTSSFNNCPNEEVELVTTYSFKPVDQEAKCKAAKKAELEKNVAEMQKQLDEMEQKLEEMR